MKLWLARHAQPLIAPGVCYGVTDVAADELATQVAAEDLARVLPVGIPIISSPLRRCEQLAHCVQALRPDLSIRTDPRLREMDFGRWEGHRWGDIPQAEFDAWTANFANYCFGGSENVSEFMRRVAQVWDEVHAAGQDVLWITHAGVIRSATLLALGVRQIENATQWPHDAPAVGQWRMLQA